ncbi:MAG: hypothetical protein ACRCUS_10505 [Anaerovoracaceae bacterium]
MGIFTCEISEILAKLQHISKVYKNAVKHLEKEVAKFPVGHLECKSKNGSGRVYVTDKTRYLSIHRPKDKKLMSKLKQKKLSNVLLPRLKKADKAMSKFIATMPVIDIAAAIEELPKAYRSVSNEGLCIVEKKRQKLRLHERSSQMLFEKEEWQKKIKTEYGFNVRSKSEADYVKIFEEMQLDYYYEPKLRIAGKTIFPDFLLIHPVTNEEIYFEHFGMITFEEYAVENFGKISFYLRNNFIQNKTVFFTFESTDAPFNISDARRIINLALQ